MHTVCVTFESNRWDVSTNFGPYVELIDESLLKTDLIQKENRTSEAVWMRMEDNSSQTEKKRWQQHQPLTNEQNNVKSTKQIPKIGPNYLRKIWTRPDSDLWITATDSNILCDSDRSAAVLLRALYFGLRTGASSSCARPRKIATNILPQQMVIEKKVDWIDAAKRDS